MGVADDWFAIVIEFATIGLVGKELLKEEGFGGWVVAFGTGFTGSVRSSGVWRATAKAATEGSRIDAPVLDIRVGVDGKVIVGWRRLESLEDRFGRTDKSANLWGWWWRRRWWLGWSSEGSRGGCGGNEGCSLVATHKTDGREVVVDVLGSISQAPEFSELEMEGSEGGVFFEAEGAAAFVEAILEIGREVGEELLG